MSAMIWVQYGPITSAVRSTTLTPTSGPVPPLPMKRSRPCHREAKADVFIVAVWHNRKDYRISGVADRVHLLADLLNGPRWAINPRGFGDDHLGHSARNGNEHLPCDGTGFVGQPTDHRCHRLRSHRRGQRCGEGPAH